MKTSKAVSSLIAECDALLKQGKISDVSVLLNKINLAEVARSGRQGLAKMCRRSGLIEKGLRVLQPVIRNEVPLDDPPLAGEIAEYSVLLSRNGSIQEAMDLLAGLDPEQAPEALLYMGFCHVSRWEYEKANTYFTAMLNSANYDDYTKLIARVNLAAGLVSLGEAAAADDLLSEALHLAQTQNATRLVGNILELRGGARVLRGDFDLANEDLERAIQLFSGSRSYDQLLIRKWQAVMAAMKSGSPVPLHQFRQEAWERKHWESVREADLFTLKLEFNQTRYDHLMFGTPMEAYRQRLRQLFGREPSESFLWGNREGRQLDLSSGTHTALKPGKKIHHLLLVLSRDFYMPANLGVLFAQTYPGEYFDFDSSPLLIRQLVKRARQWIASNRIPLAIVNSEAGYQLVPGRDLGILLPLERTIENTATLQWQQLTDLFKEGEPFTIRQASAKLRLSPRSIHRLISSALAKGQLVKLGRSRAVRYMLHKQAG